MPETTEPDTLHRLAEIRRIQGREPIDPTVIDGFGLGAPSPPPLDLPPGFDAGADDDDEAPPVSPAVTVSLPPRTAPVQPPPPLEFAIVAVVGGPCEITCEGATMQISDDERRSFKDLVAGALERKFAALRTRRKRQRRPPLDPASVLPAGAIVPEPRRKVRRRSLLKDH